MEKLYDAVLETEEYISADEYLRRRERGEIDPRKVRYALQSPDGKEFGGFWVKLPTPRYRVAFERGMFGKGACHV